MTVSRKDMQVVLDNLEEGQYKCYFFCPDFNKPSGGVGLLYDHVRILNELGFNAVVLHQKPGFKIDWLAERAEGVPIEYLQDGKLNLNMQDFFFIPEGFPNVMQMLQEQNVPAKKIVFCQNWYYILNALQPGQTWQSLGIGDCLSVSQSQTRYIQAIMPGMRCKNVVGSINPDVFFPPASDLDKKPIVTFYPSRDGGTKSANVIKTFYLLFPHFKWIQFRQLGGLSTEDYAAALRESAFYVHFDEYSSWGTAPIEAWRSRTLVAGWDGFGGVEYMRPVVVNKAANPALSQGNMWLAPNGDIIKLALQIGNMIETWITNEVSEQIYKNMAAACELYTPEAERDSILAAHNAYREERIVELTKYMDSLPTDVEEVANGQQSE